MSQAIEPKPINRFIVTLAVGAGVGIGSAPFMALIDRPGVWLIISVSSLLVAFITLSFGRRTTYNSPSFGEYLLSAFNATFAPAFLGVLGMAFYYLLFVLILGVEWLVQMVSAVEWDQARLAYIITMVIAVPLYSSLAWIHAREISVDLAPETAGLQSPYYYILTVDRSFLRKNLIGDLVGLLVLILGGYFWLADWVFLVLLQLFFFSLAPQISLVPTSKIASKPPRPREWKRG